MSETKKKAASPKKKISKPLPKKTPAIKGTTKKVVKAPEAPIEKKDEAVKPAVTPVVSAADDGISDEVILSVRHLKQFFRFGTGIYKYNKAVHDVSFDIHRGEVLGLVGESGCGKTTTGRSIIKLYDITSGSVYFEGERISAGTRWNEKEIKFKRKKAAAKIKELQGEKAEEIEALLPKDPSYDEEKAHIANKYDPLIKQVKDELEAVVSLQRKEIALAKHDDKYCNKDYAKQKVAEVNAKYSSLRRSLKKDTSLNEGCYEEFSNIIEKYRKKKLAYSASFEAESAKLKLEQDALLSEAKAYLASPTHSKDEKYAFVEKLLGFVETANKSIDTSKIDDVDERKYAKLDKSYRGLVSALPFDVDKASFGSTKDIISHYIIERRLASNEKITSRMQMIFQDPIASLDPRMTVKEIIAEGLRIRGVKDKDYIDEKVQAVLKEVGLLPEHASRYPHEFSGGQRQRIGIARALIMDPDLIIADEPISALDVSIQAQIINLLNDLRRERHLTILFIAHDLSVVKYFCSRIAVMYFGNLVELASSDELFKHPLHPYTVSLLSAIPLPDPHYEKNRKRIDYNPMRDHDYSVEKPSFREVVPGHFVRCSDSELAKYLELEKK